MNLNLKQAIQPNQPFKRTWRSVNGIVLLDKGLGLSSNQALQQVRRLFQAEKAGHTGTLDPLATGLLPICCGEASKFSQGLLEANKTYTARIGLGIITSTGDAEGEVLSRQTISIDQEQLNQAIQQLTGIIHQTPPMYSALKHQGQPLYALARQGIEVKREPREVTIFEFKLLNIHYDLTNQLSEPYAAGTVWLDVTARVSKGTYIRTLAYDLGELLGCGAYLMSLRRTKVGDFSIEDAMTFETMNGLLNLNELDTLSNNNDTIYSQLDTLLRPVDSMLSDYEAIELNTEQATLFMNGGRVKLYNVIHKNNLNTINIINTNVKLYYQQQFLGIATMVYQDINQTAVLHPVRLIKAKQI